MNIKLDYIIRRNKSSLEVFIQKNKLTSYQRLLEYCKTRKFIPCSEEEYNKAAKIAEVSVEETTKKASREVSKTQTPKKRRYRRKKQQGTPKLSDSPDKR